MRISLLHETDVRDAATRVMTLSRDQLGRVTGLREPGAIAPGNPYVQLFVELFRYARGDTGDDAKVATQLEVAGSVLDNPIYAGAAGQTESPLLRLVIAAARARRKQRAGAPLTAEEAALLS